MFKKIALILALFACVSFAQKDNPFIYSGSKAVLFSFSGLSNLGANDFDGGAGMKFFVTSPMALRFGVQVGISGTTTPANPDANEIGVDGSTSSTSFGLEAALEYHLTSTRLTPYLGGGAGFTMTTNESKPAETGPANQPLYQTTTKNRLNSGAGTSFNVFALMGVEYFIVNEISLAAEYRLGYSILSPKDEEVSSNRPGSVTVTSKGVSSHDLFLNSAGFLTLAVYF